MLKYIYILIVLLPSQLFAQNSFTITGTFSDYNGLIYLQRNNVVDSTPVKNGRFSYRGYMGLPIPASLFISNAKPVYYNEFVLEPGGMTVRVDTITKYDDGKELCKVNTEVIKGGNTNNLLTSFRDSLKKKGSHMENKSVMERKQFYITELKKFVNEHPAQMASLILVENANPAFSHEELLSIYEKFPAILKNSYYGISLKTAIDKSIKSNVYTKIRDFSQADVNGKVISINHLQGNIVFIDFWASWCIPCREIHPDLLKIYQKYNDKGFQILGVSLDSDRKHWVEAIKHDKLTWLNVSDLKGVNNDVAQMFNITTIPDNILIDKDGRIIAKNISPPELEKIIATTLSTL